MEPKPKVTADEILNYMKDLVESRKSISREVWLDVSFKLNLTEEDEVKLLNKMRQEVAKKKLAILNSQEKRNVSAVDLEIEASDEFRFMKDQEAKINAIDQFIMISKKNADNW